MSDAPEGQISPSKPQKMQVKVYLVCMFLNLAAPGTPNIRITDAYLTRRAAADAVDRTPGTYIVKLVAGK